MAKKSRLGSDPIKHNLDINPDGPDTGNEQKDGVDLLIRDTRTGPKSKASHSAKKEAESKAGKAASPKAGKKPADNVITEPEAVPAQPIEPKEQSGPVAGPKAAPVTEAKGTSADVVESKDFSLLLKGHEARDDSEQFLEFSLGEEHFAFQIERVREVLTLVKLTSIPQSPVCMAGVINLRGSAVPVVDLRLLFGLKKAEDTVNTCIIIVEVIFEKNKTAIGAIADSVSEVFDLKKSNISPAPTIGSHINTSFIKGMGKKDDRFSLILNPEEVFSSLSQWKH
jgi:purine-binding chemotaxis protein CheW